MVRSQALCVGQATSASSHHYPRLLCDLPRCGRAGLSAGTPAAGIRGLPCLVWHAWRRADHLRVQARDAALAREGQQAAPGAAEGLTSHAFRDVGISLGGPCPGTQVQSCCLHVLHPATRLAQTPPPVLLQDPVLLPQPAPQPAHAMRLCTSCAAACAVHAVRMQGYSPAGKAPTDRPFVAAGAAQLQGPARQPGDGGLQAGCLHWCAHAPLVSLQLFMILPAIGVGLPQKTRKKLQPECCMSTARPGACHSTSMECGPVQMCSGSGSSVRRR